MPAERVAKEVATTEASTLGKTKQTLEQPLTSLDSKNAIASSSVIARLASSALGSIVTAFVVTPLDVVKVRQQAASSSQSPSPKVTPCPKGCGTFVLNNGLMECTLPKSCASFFDAKTGEMTPRAAQLQRDINIAKLNKGKRFDLGAFGMVRKIFMQEGFAGIYAGLTPTLVMAVPSTVLYFTAYDEISSRLKHYSQAHGDTSTSGEGHASYVGAVTSDMWIPLVGGSTSRFFTTAVTAPLELIRTRQASRVGQGQGCSAPAPGLIQELRHLVQTRGISSLYQGLAPTLWRDVPFSAIYWLTVEQVKTMFQHYQNAEGGSESVTHAQAVGRAFVGGALGGMVAAAFTTPFDVVKTRQQMVGSASSTTATATAASEAMQVVEATALCDHNGAIAVHHHRTPKPLGVPGSGTLVMMRYITQTEGIQGLWRGNVTRMYKVVPACAIMISCYDLGKKVLE